jgi:hypothetical protein
VLAALRLEEPDAVPWVELAVDWNLGRKVTGLAAEASVFELTRALGMDAVGYWGCLCPYSVKMAAASTGRGFVTGGAIGSEADLDKLNLPDLEGLGRYEEAARFLEGAGELATYAVLWLGIDPTWHALGIEGFSYALYDGEGLVEKVLDRYVEWSIPIAERLSGLGFDFIWAADDIAHSQGPFFSPKTYREVILPRIRRVAERIRKPWAYHSDGNLLPIIEEYLGLGMNAMHPFEPYSMDVFEFKQNYGERVCIIGNVDINTLTLGSPQDVEYEVKEKIQRLGRGGGYCISSSNSIPAYAKAENLAAMAEAIRRYRRLPYSGKVEQFEGRANE